jgi:hypothetical protein
MAAWLWMPVSSCSSPMPPDAVAPRRRVDEHALQFALPGSAAHQGAAARRVAVEARDKEPDTVGR